MLKTNNMKFKIKLEKTNEPYSARQLNENLKDLKLVLPEIVKNTSVIKFITKKILINGN